MTYISKFRKNTSSLWLLASSVLLALSACGELPSRGTAPPAIQIEQKETLVFGKRHFIAHPRPEHFSICYGYTCAEVDYLSLKHDQWAIISQLLTDAQTPEQELQAIRAAVARLEKISGELTGTDQDRGRNLSGWGLSGQMDCIDESTNTTVYLTMMQVQGLLRWHTVEPRVSRGLGSLQAPHFTAVVRQIETRQLYAVDSWFLDNGEPPFVVPLAEWKSGWQPDA